MKPTTLSAVVVGGSIVAIGVYAHRKNTNKKVAPQAPLLREWLSRPM
jgi:hypothetical protein